MKENADPNSKQSPAGRQHRPGTRHFVKVPKTLSEIEALLDTGNLGPKPGYDFVFETDRKDPSFDSIRTKMINQLLATPHIAPGILDIADYKDKIGPLTVSSRTVGGGLFEGEAETRQTGKKTTGKARSTSPKRAEQLAMVDILGQVLDAPIERSKLEVPFPDPSVKPAWHRSRKPIGKLEAVNGELSVYATELSESGPPHAKQFKMRVTFYDQEGEMHKADASHSSKSRAENAAAQKILDTLGLDTGKGL